MKVNDFTILPPITSNYLPDGRIQMTIPGMIDTKVDHERSYVGRFYAPARLWIHVLGPHAVGVQNVRDPEGSIVIEPNECGFFDVLVGEPVLLFNRAQGTPTDLEFKLCTT